MDNQNIGSQLKLKIASLNVRGMRNPKKRRSLFYSFKRKKFDIICLQETHLTEKDRRIIEREWGYRFHLSAGTNDSKGLLTLFQKHINLNDDKRLLADERCLISRVVIENISFDIINVYAPCVEREKFQFLYNINEYLEHYLDNESSSHRILLGDFNMVLNNSLDIVAGNPHNKEVVKYFNYFVNENLLLDCWREKNKHRKDFTWSKRKPISSRRLDYIFVSESLFPFCRSPDITTVGFSDHRAVSIGVDFSTFERGQSTYKFNTSLLRNSDFVADVVKEIERIETLDLDPHLSWEYIKVQIKEIGQSYGKRAAAQKKKEKKNLEIRINEIEKNLVLNPADEFLITQYSELQKQLEIHVIYETEGARIRSGQKWAQEGEKCTRFFLSLEKQRSNENTIFSLVDSENNGLRYLNDPKEIVEYIKGHFEKLYKKNENEINTSNRDFIKDGTAGLLDENDKLMLDEHLTESEVLTALKLSNNKSAPGSDGLPGEVYKFFWNNLKRPLVKCYEFSYINGVLCDSQYKGVICLHHKGKGLERDKIENWRPISLTNFDYKLLAKVLALRMNKCLHKCIHRDQYAFIKGRQISDLLREIEDIVFHERSNKSNTMLLSLDYAKAFDTLSNSAVMEALRYFEFGDNFCKWIEILLKSRTSYVKNGGYLSRAFKMERGVRQGCPISPLLFIITVELLARDIRENDNIKGIAINDDYPPIKIKMYADDTTLFLKDMIDYREVLSRIKAFSVFSGLCLNKRKSYCMILGDKTQTGRVKFDIKFVNSIKILGVTFSNEKDSIDNSENIDTKIFQLKRMCKLWSRRKLTLIGKITLLKALGLPLFIYTMQSIGIRDDKLKEIEKVFFNFIWLNNDGKIVPDKVSRQTICSNYYKGGLNMIDIKKFQTSFLLKWADRYCSDENANWKMFPDKAYYGVGGKYAFKSNIKSRRFKGLENITSPFWKRVLTAFLDNNSFGEDISLGLADPIFNNCKMTFKNSVIFSQQCIKKGIRYIKDLFINTDLMSLEQFRHHMQFSPDSTLIYNVIFNAIIKHKEQLQSQFANIGEGIDEDEGHIYFQDIPVGNIERNAFYEILNGGSKTISLHTEWRIKYDLEEEDPKVWTMALECTKEVKLRELQWKILHNIYPTSTLRFKMKLRNDENCVFCGQRDTISHFFVDCSFINKIWNKAEYYIFCEVGSQIKLDEKTILIGFNNGSSEISAECVNFINYICLIAKNTISKAKFYKTKNCEILFEKDIELRKLL